MPRWAVGAVAFLHLNAGPDMPVLGSAAWLGWPLEDFEMPLKQSGRLVTG